MTVAHSLGLRNYMNASGYKSAFDTTGRINVYSGAPPANPDAAATGTLLVTFTLPATVFGTSSGGVLTAAAISAATPVATGTAGWFRQYLSAESPAGASGTTTTATTFRRMDGTVTVTGGGGDMQLDSTGLVSGNPVTLTTFTYTAPS